jgi:hypothetical protein
MAQMDTDDNLRVTISFGVIAAMFASAYLIPSIFVNEVFVHIWIVALFFSIFAGEYLILMALALSPEKSGSFVQGQESRNFLKDWANLSYGLAVNAVIAYIVLLGIFLVFPPIIFSAADLVGKLNISNEFLAVVIIIFALVVNAYKSRKIVFSKLQNLKRKK